jgi:WD40 repeat protein
MCGSAIRGVASRVAFSDDGKHAVSGSTDFNACRWDVATGKEVHSFAGT